MNTKINFLRIENPEQILDTILWQLADKTEDSPLDINDIIWQSDLQLSNRDKTAIFEKLKRDGLAESINIKTHTDYPQTDKRWYITFDGIVFLRKGGYVQQLLDSERENIRLKNIENRQIRLAEVLNVLTGLIAIGTGIAALYYLTQVYDYYVWNFCFCY